MNQPTLKSVKQPTKFHALPLSEDRLPNRFQSGKPRELAEVPPLLRQYVDELRAGRRKWPLFLHGPVGSGKSCAALCLVDRVAKSEFWAMPARPGQEA